MRTRYQLLLISAAHLGVAKTTARLQRHFYWPGITSDVKQFCRTCDACQRLAVAGKPLHAKYHGPYTVLEQLGPVDYVISTPDRRKVKRVCHINLLKQYHVRDASLCPPVDSDVSDFVGIADSVESDVLPPREPQLSASQSCELTSLISEFEEIFSEQPGKTPLVQHHTKLTPGATPSRSAVVSDFVVTADCSSLFVSSGG